MMYDAERRKLLGLNLKAARRRAGLAASTASALIAAKGLKCSRGTLLAWERGVGRTSREPFCSDLNLIASVYQCSVNDFFRNAVQVTANGNGASVQANAGQPETPSRGESLQTSYAEVAGTSGASSV